MVGAGKVGYMMFAPGDVEASSSAVLILPPEA
jgi:hypothetical protein